MTDKASPSHEPMGKTLPTNIKSRLPDSMQAEAVESATKGKVNSDSDCIMMDGSTPLETSYFGENVCQTLCARFVERSLKRHCILSENVFGAPKFGNGWFQGNLGWTFANFIKHRNG
ncbi:hypothetical protein M9H77_29956 [Catharanthus roseus]|uniref:Uncharacterized protein n=1 Tax=Catharanthus roseus TaxID=4058 RepID=A0ACB9ZXV5_CATRO|nr:hypothetical protein M9H77_29956 [Catharanthus roseus]